MSLDFGGAALLVAVTAILTVALLVGWLSFGRMGYALLWTMAALGEVAKWLVNASAAERPDYVFIAMIASAVLTVVDSALVLIGFYRRNDRPIPWRAIIAAGCAVVVIGLYGEFFAVPRHPELRPALSNLFCSVMFAWGALITRPRQPPINVADYTAVGAILLFSAYTLCLAAIWLGVGGGGQNDDFAQSLHASALVIGLPVAYIAAGVGALLLVASDLYERSRLQATRDPVTGAFNRRGLEQAMVPVLANARRRHQPLSLVVIDIGDAARMAGGAVSHRLLSAAADALNAVIREEDMFGHLGDGEFCIVLIDAGMDVASNVALRMRSAFEELDFATPPGRRVFTTSGVAMLEADDVALGGLIRRARTMMNDAKLAFRASEAPNSMPNLA